MTLLALSAMPFAMLVPMPVAMSVAVLTASWARPVAMLCLASSGFLRAASCRASVAIAWNCCVSAPHHCIGSAKGAAGAASAGLALLLCGSAASTAGGACLAAAFCASAWLGGTSRPAKVLGVSAARGAFAAALPARVSQTLSLKALATSPMLKFMPLSVASVIFCTSSA